MVERAFEVRARGSTVARELQAGVTTFAAMAYILAVNPSVLSAAGMDRAALVTVTALASAAATAVMALVANYPLALAPGMGINAFFAYTICVGAGIPWQQALGMVFVNGIVFLALSLSGVRERIVNALPRDLTLAITGGIGLFIAFIGLRSGGLVVASPATLVTHGDFTSGAAVVSLTGIALTAALVAKRVPGAIIIGILSATGLGLCLKDASGAPLTQLPGSWLALPASPAPVALQLDLRFLTDSAAFLSALPLILALLLVDMFDNIGTLIGVATRAGLLDPSGRLPRVGRVLVADSVAAILSGLLGTSTVVSYVESASGVEAGGRTGLTALTTAACFIGALVFTPLILAVPAAATGPALVVVGVLMLQAVTEIDMRDVVAAVPAALTLVGIPLLFSVADGIGLGLLAFAVLALATGRPRALTATGYVVAAIFFLQFFKLPPFAR
jgi:AGZA family xanthine/uracil permease-like MFS transporter